MTEATATIATEPRTPAHETILKLDAVSKRFPGADSEAIVSLSLELKQGELVSLLGESGSGKTTVLRLIAGFEVPDRGSIRIHDKVVADARTMIGPERRGISMVFQDNTLFPHLTVARNIAYGIDRLTRKGQRARVSEMLDKVELSGYEERYPHELSFGEQQRIALARALAPKPDLLLLDEPFSNLDDIVKVSVRRQVMDVIRSSGIATILVTHDAKEALAFSDRVAILRRGSLQQVASPVEVYSNPRTCYVARFIGDANLLNATEQDGCFHTRMGSIVSPKATEPGREVILSVHPEHFHICAGGNGGIKGTVRHINFCGQYHQVTLDVTQNDGLTIPLTFHSTDGDGIRVNDTITVTPDKDRIGVLTCEPGCDGVHHFR